MARAIADWWDAVELWLTQLPFPFQVMLAALVVVPLCWGTAALVDVAVDRVVAGFAARRARRASPAPVPRAAGDG